MFIMNLVMTIAQQQRFSRDVDSNHLELSHGRDDYIGKYLLLDIDFNTNEW